MIKGIPTALATIVIGGIAAYIAYRQYRVAHAKFKLDLFQKRYEIYLATVGLLSKLALGTTLSDRTGWEFRGETAAAKFLFDGDVAMYVDGLADKVSVATRSTSDVYQRWAEDELQTVSARFQPYMRMSEWR